MYDDTLFVVTADHGMSFAAGEFGRRVATAGNVDQVLWVPTFIKQPGQDEGRVDPGSGLVPAQVGRVNLAAGVPDRPVVAVAVNGVIAGVSATFRERRDAKGSQPVGPPDKFSALTLDTAYRKGENRLELFMIDDSGGRVRRRPLTVS
jgi:hypothetical protein